MTTPTFARHSASTVRRHLRFPRVKGSAMSSLSRPRETDQTGNGGAVEEGEVEAILERVLRAYHRDEGHGGANRIGESILDGDLVPVAREAFLGADDMPPDHDVLQVLDSEEMHLLGE